LRSRADSHDGDRREVVARDVELRVPRRGAALVGAVVDWEILLSERLDDRRAGDLEVVGRCPFVMREGALHVTPAVRGLRVHDAIEVIADAWRVLESS
jgi:hypothetical protein